MRCAPAAWRSPPVSAVTKTENALQHRKPFSPYLMSSALTIAKKTHTQSLKQETGRVDHQNARRIRQTDVARDKYSMAHARRRDNGTKHEWYRLRAALWNEARRMSVSVLERSANDTDWRLGGRTNSSEGEPVRSIVGGIDQGGDRPNVKGGR